MTMRDETEWMETLEAGRNELAGCRRERIRAAFEAALRKPRMPLHAEGNGTPPSALMIQHLCAVGGRNTSLWDHVVGCAYSFSLNTIRRKLERPRIGCLTSPGG